VVISLFVDFSVKFFFPPTQIERIIRRTDDRGRMTDDGAQMADDGERDEENGKLKKL